MRNPHHKHLRLVSGGDNSGKGEENIDEYMSRRTKEWNDERRRYRKMEDLKEICFWTGFAILLVLIAVAGGCEIGGLIGIQPRPGIM